MMQRRRMVMTETMMCEGDDPLLGMQTWNALLLKVTKDWNLSSKHDVEKRANKILTT